ncbi:DEAD/DEAH box helicase [Salinisphaera sp. T31B1]|uniref:DEAD/DEAH box helicase n=1 Tax=Salinisphaera sp. T31B1 TaxID=727963 RepID=UPI00333FCD14
MNNYFANLSSQALSRATESTLSILGITDPALRAHLGDIMSRDPGNAGSFLAPPVFEQMFGWETSPQTMNDLATDGSMLSREVVNSLDNAANGRYRFGADWQPFTHQLASWRSLLEKKHSVIVTSGTGSGKTECFMVPVLEDLHREYVARGRQPLEGVRALFLYPLNALINSQRERLDAWTRGFGNGIRYCLYNGNTEETARNRAEQAQRPNEVLSRQLMREKPAPILVTNGTMLEYMMVRQVDAPIVRKSRAEKSLRWIVLDEAHTYVGSQAAELALQLRRVMTNFGAEPENIRFVATSATIAGDPDATGRLKRFLSDLSGVAVANIDVWDGQRVTPELPPCRSRTMSLDELESIPADSPKDREASKLRYDALVHSPEARRLRGLVVDAEKPLTLTEIITGMHGDSDCKPSAQETLRWLDVCSGTRPASDKPAFLKLRGHFFQRTTHGLWACFDANCSAKRGTSLENGWPFGYVYPTQRQTCTCGSPVFELAFCHDCNEPHLLARDAYGRLMQWEGVSIDEFSLQEETPADDDQTIAGTKQDHIQPQLALCPAANAGENYLAQCFDKRTGSFDLGSDDHVQLGLRDSDPQCSRPGCEYRGSHGRQTFRRALLGAPFYVSSAVPTLLEHCKDFESSDYGKQSLPGRGRRLITFTDSRQGTARMSVRMQQEAERSRLRGLVVEILSWHQRRHAQEVECSPDLDAETLHGFIADARKKADQFRNLGLHTQAKREEQSIDEFRQKLNTATGNKPRIPLISLSWGEVVNELSSKEDIRSSILDYNRYLDPETFGRDAGPLKLSELLLFREFARRPKRQNSLETLGLVKLGYAGLEHIDRSPERWEQNGLTLDDWRSFLIVALDFYVRENTYVQADRDWTRWVGAHFSPKTLRTPLSEEKDEIRIKRWPQIRGGYYSQRLIKLLLLGANLSPSDTSHVDLVNSWLQAAWKQLTQTSFILKPDGNQYSLPLQNIRFSLTAWADVCPVTNKLLTTSFKGLTPYLPAHIDFSRSVDELRERYRTLPVEMPEIWRFDNSQEDYDTGLRKIRAEVGHDPLIASLRVENLWTDISDRAVEGGFYYRTAEHSAQQSAGRLEQYESKFQKGQVNVLNCSTTMEMGVDIGGISAVAMNNVPPHPANYLQRAGRAGRGSESRAIAYTLCKNNPHDQQVFMRPEWPFETAIPAPAVALNSEKLVQRHVNSLLLSDYLCNIVAPTRTEKTKLNTAWFFHNEAGPSHCDQFMERLALAELKCLDDALYRLVKRTALDGIKPHRLRQYSLEAIKKLQERWQESYRNLSAQEASAEPKTPFRKRLEIEKSRHCQEYLLRDLAARTFLPGYGFPTDVVNFDNFTIEDYLREIRGENKEREDNIARYKGLPSRNLAIAIREYAPGAEIVLDGRVFTSAGVSLHWHNLSSESKEAQKMDTAWRCDVCGQVGYEEGLGQMSELTCSNNRCQSLIKPNNIRKVLQPTGFVTDAYAPISNNVQRQKFIPVETPWVFVRATPVPLPNPALGDMSFAHDGRVFHYSAGENGQGYALCLGCGRADSMSPQGEYPPGLRPSQNHFPPRPGKEDKDSNNHRVACPESGNVKAGIYLGTISTTDVFELIIRNPETGEYLLDSDKECQQIALTLAVAMRAALAGTLGISRDELGYATRPSKLPEGQAALVLQLFDVVSGGAGFSSSAPEHVEALLLGMAKQLECEFCETSCSECLLDSQTRHDFSMLNRKLALQWLGQNFTRHVVLTRDDQLGLEDARYCPGSMEIVLRRLINRGAHKVSMRATGDASEWDLLAPQFNKAIQQYLFNDELEIDLLLPDHIGDQVLLQDLDRLRSLGARIGLANKRLPQPLAAQVFLDGKIITLATGDTRATVPGENWHQAGEIVVSSESCPAFELQPFDFPDTNLAPVAIIQIRDEANAPWRRFGSRFWNAVIAQCPAASELLKDAAVSRIWYSDRYIQNPAAVAILSSILSYFRGRLTSDAHIGVHTLFKSGKWAGRKTFEDWAEQQDFELFLRSWVSTILDKPVDVTVATSNRDIPHHRKLGIEFSSGKTLELRLDQGVGYWQLWFRDRRDALFDFDQIVERQLVAMGEKLKYAEVRNSTDKWPTDIFAEVLT